MDYRAVAGRELEAMAVFRSPWLRAAFDAVDRESFAPSRFWALQPDEQGLLPVVDRSLDTDSWQRAVWDTHRSLITQIDDGRTPQEGPARGDYTSSISALDIVFEKLNHLGLEPYHRVLELGTGSWYHTALLCERVGADRVTTVEIDPALAAWGTRNLKQAGYEPDVITGDGLAGWTQNARYDRIINTASLRTIPTAWREQTADDGVILTPFNTLYAGGGLLKLHVQGGVASGRFVGSASYMWARSQRPELSTAHVDTYTMQASPIDPDQVLDRTWAQDFCIGLYVPHLSVDIRNDAGGSRQAQIRDDTSESVTIVRFADWWDQDAVTIWGRRNLWNDIVAAYTTWRTAGQPHPTRYGLTFDHVGQHLWLDEPDRAALPG
ncbi:hypothetical protein [Streptomyces sp. NPDC059161]|uniref:hypothetical protein n=1 Tax=unclassified Streptomyces TaxID=2593676 RepID=UPI00365256D7